MGKRNQPQLFFLEGLLLLVLCSLKLYLSFNQNVHLQKLSALGKRASPRPTASRCGPGVHHPDTGSGFWLRYGFSRGKWIAPNKKKLRKAWYYFRRSFCTENSRVSIKTMPHKEVVRFAISTPWLLAGTLPDVQIPSLAPGLPVGGGFRRTLSPKLGSHHRN